MTSGWWCVTMTLRGRLWHFADTVMDVWPLTPGDTPTTSDTLTPAGAQTQLHPAHPSTTPPACQFFSTHHALKANSSYTSYICMYVYVFQPYSKRPWAHEDTYLFIFDLKLQFYVHVSWNQIRVWLWIRLVNSRLTTLPSFTVMRQNVCKHISLILEILTE